MTKILYLHGFASSADSSKAKIIESFVKKNTNSTKILIPNLNNNIMHFISAYLENSVFLEYRTQNLRRNDFLQM